MYGTYGTHGTCQVRSDIQARTTAQATLIQGMPEAIGRDRVVRLWARFDPLLEEYSSVEDPLVSTDSSLTSCGYYASVDLGF